MADAHNRHCPPEHPPSVHNTPVAGHPMGVPKRRVRVPPTCVDEVDPVYLGLRGWPVAEHLWGEVFYRVFLRVRPSDPQLEEEAP